jgi:Pilus assembly protein, PilO
MSSRSIESSPAKIAVLLVGVLVLLAAATWLLLIQPQTTKSSNLDATIKSAQTKIVALSKGANAERVSAHRKVVSQNFVLNKALPPVAGMPQILNQMNRIAVEEHVSLDSVTPQAFVPYSTYQEIPMTVGLSGSFVNIEGFLQQLRKQVATGKHGGVSATGRLYDVTAVNLSTSTSSTSGAQLTATLTVNAFYFYTAPVAPISTPTSTTPAG